MRIGTDTHEVLRGFLDRTARVLQLVEGFMPECEWLDDAGTLTHLHACVSTKRHRVRVPEMPMYLDGLLADQPLTGGLEPMLGAAHLRVLTIVGFPTATMPGILDDFNALAFPYCWSTRAIMLDKLEATKRLTWIRRQWFAKWSPRTSRPSMRVSPTPAAPRWILCRPATNSVTNPDAG
jgi:type IV secretion system protein VirB4